MEKVIETNCLADIIIEAGKRTNIPYLRGGAVSYTHLDVYKRQILVPLVL